jgi:hypothetical protein
VAPEPGYSRLAVSDPSADMTATQTWAVLDDGQLGDGWTAPSATDGPREAADGGAAKGAPWPSIPADAPGQDQATPWADGPSADASGPLPGSTGKRPGRRRASQDADGPDVPGSGFWPGPDPDAAGGFPGDAETTGRFLAGAETTGRYKADADTTGRYKADADTTGRYKADAKIAGVGSPGAAGSRVSHAAARGRKPRKPPSHARMWLLPILMVLAVGALVTVAYLHFVKGPASKPRVSAPVRTAVAPSSPAPSLGPWKHITTRSEDSVPLTLTELFPAQFSSGGTTAARTIDHAAADCPAAVLGAGLQSAVHKAGCTQVMRASYLATNQQIMGTIGVLNLVDATSAQRAGQATGSAEFIDQLPAAKGPTHNLTKGTGLEEAVYKGHYLILIWAEFTNLRTPATAAQRAALKTFSDDLVSGTANVSLTSRMVIGKPQTQ